MVQAEIALVKFCRDPAIAVSSFVFMVDGRDLRFFEFRRISFVWYSFWHNKSPHLLDSISYCLTNGVQFRNGAKGDILFHEREYPPLNPPREGFRLAVSGLNNLYAFGMQLPARGVAALDVAI